MGSGAGPWGPGAPPEGPWLGQRPTAREEASFQPVFLAPPAGVPQGAFPWQQPWSLSQQEGNYASTGGIGENWAPPPPPLPPPLAPPGTLPWWTWGPASVPVPPFAAPLVQLAAPLGAASPALPPPQAQWYWAPPGASPPNESYEWDDEERRAASIMLLGLRDGASVSVDLAWAAAALLPRNAHCAMRLQRRQSRRRLREARRLYRYETPLFGVPYGLPGVYWHAKGVGSPDDLSAAVQSEVNTDDRDEADEAQELMELWKEEAHRHSMPGRGYLTVFRILGGQGDVMRLFENVPEWAVADQSPDARHLGELDDSEEIEPVPEPEPAVPAGHKAANSRRRTTSSLPAGAGNTQVQAPAAASGAIRGRGGNLERLLAPGTDVAFRVKDDEGEWNWILGTVCCYLSEERKYRIADRGEEMVEAFEQRGDECSTPANRLDGGKYRLYQVARSRVRPLPSRAADNLRLRPSMKVLALYPGTSALYPATVLESAEMVMKEPGHPHGMAYKLVFENEDADEDEEDSADEEHAERENDAAAAPEAVPFKYVHARFVLPLL
ncbi:hypothetical protein F1559_002689 [Cyanidiococcus yangmingshanensis]|uniref:SGF29 C-terminal domain-containing protein n=1 Tax=Cyanidiococcus yangmingshanensis TaxID=2690220 RepID=A0A7J7IEI0_9RHOD|nr:hypothetical protein F1559_002689 [Cyanidiococcus yangmingshanensis]